MLPRLISIRVLPLAIAVALVAGCAEEPLAPTVQVYPAQNKPFPTFQSEQAQCEQYAGQAVAARADEANERGLGEAIITTALGAGFGAIVGGGRGAAIGTVAGGAVGADIGASSSSRADYTIQQQYDMVYAQCMYAKGNQVAGYAPRYYAPAPVYYPAPGYVAAPGYVPPGYVPAPAYVPPPAPAYPPPASP